MARLGVLAAASLAMMVPGIAMMPIETTAAQSVTQQQAPTPARAVTMGVRKEDDLSERELRWLLRGLRDPETRHRTAGDRAHKRMKRRRAAGRKQ
jgi:hypothetical protein